MDRYSHLARCPVTPEECGRLVERFVATWPAGVRGAVWTDVLRPLDYDMAKAVYLRLRDNAHRPPSIAEFRDGYAFVQRQRRRAVEDRQARLPFPTEVVHAPDDPLALAAYARGLTHGRADLEAIRRRAGLPRWDVATQSSVAYDDELGPPSPGTADVASRPDTPPGPSKEAP